MIRLADVRRRRRQAGVGRRCDADGREDRDTEQGAGRREVAGTRTDDRRKRRRRRRGAVVIGRVTTRTLNVAFIGLIFAASQIIIYIVNYCYVTFICICHVRCPLYIDCSV